MPLTVPLTSERKRTPTSRGDGSRAPSPAPGAVAPQIVTGVEAVDVTMSNGWTADVPPPGAGLVTVTLAVALAASNAAGTDAVNFVGPRTEVVSGVPFQRTCELAMN